MLRPIRKAKVAKPGRVMLRIEVDDRESAGAVLPVVRECADFHV
jgi:hypothetical protein